MRRSPKSSGWASLLLLAAGFLFGLQLTATALTRTWTGSAGDNDFNNGANWNSGALQAGDLVVLGAAGPSDPQSLRWTADLSLSGLTFLSGVPAYKLWLPDTRFQDSGHSITLTGPGIVSASANAPAIDLSAWSSLSFVNSASAGPASIHITDGCSVNFANHASASNAAILTESGATLTFADQTTAASATLGVSADPDMPFRAGRLVFSGQSTADHATITAAPCAEVEFDDQAGAGNAQITLRAGSLVFNQQSTAGNATIINDGLTNTDSPVIGGATTFDDDATAGRATIINRNGGQTDFANYGPAVIRTSGGNATFINESGGSTYFNPYTSAGDALYMNSGGGNTTLYAAYAGSATFINNDGGSTWIIGGSAGRSSFINNQGGTTSFGEDADAAASSVLNNAGGTLDLTGLYDHITLGSIAGAGNILLGGHTLTTGGLGTSAEISGVISGLGGSLVKIGNGTLTLSGANTYTGVTSVNAGALNLTGLLAGDAVVASGALLTGGGRLQGLTNGGRVAPGTGAAGTLSAASYSGHGLLDIAFNGKSHNALEVRGNANLSAGSLRVTGSDFRQGNYDVVTAGSLTGTFASVTLPPPTALLNFSVDVDTLNKKVRVDVDKGKATALTASANQGSVAAVLDASGDSASGSFATVISAVNALPSAADVQNACQQMSGDSLTSFQSMGLHGASAFADQMNQRAASIGMLSEAAPSGPVQVAYVGDLRDLGIFPVPAPSTKEGVWARGVGLFDYTAADPGSGSPSSEANTGGFQLGYDHAFGNAWLAGLSGGYTQTDLTVGDRSSSGQIHGNQLGLYARYAPAAWFFNGSFSFVQNANDMTRTLTIGPLQEQALADFHSRVYSTFLEAGYAWVPQTAYSLQPSVSLRESHFHQNGYTETGAPGLDLSVDPQTLDSLASSLGARLTRTFRRRSDHPSLIGVRAAWQHEWADNVPLLSAQFADAPGTHFTAQGTPQSRDAADLGLDGRVIITQNLQLFADYSDILSPGRNTQTIMGGLRILF